MAWKRIEGSSSPEEERGLTGSSDGLGLFLAAVSVAGVLAMVATWLLVAYYPIPDDEAIYVGLLGFFFVVFLDFFLIYHIAGPEVRKGQRISAVKTSVSLILLGLLVASVVGSLPWLLSRLIAAIPWIQEFPWGVLFLALCLVADDLLRRRKPAEDDHRYSWKSLIFQGILVVPLITWTLSSVVSRFSDGKAWLGALYLALALLLGLHAVYAFVDIWRIWRRRREKSHESIA